MSFSFWAVLLRLFGIGRTKPDPDIVPAQFSLDVNFVVRADGKPVPNATVTLVPDLDSTNLVDDTDTTGAAVVVVRNKGLRDTGASYWIAAEGYTMAKGRRLVNGQTEQVTLVKIPTFGNWHTDGRTFRMANGAEWKMKFVTDFGLLNRFIKEGPSSIDGLIEQRRSVGANGSRVLGMVTWQDLYPQQVPDYLGQLREFFRYTADKQWAIEFVVFADTPSIMPSLGQQQVHWQSVVQVAREFDHVLLELVNEWNHSANYLDVSQFAPPDYPLCSRGSGLGGAYPAMPVWHYAGVHDARDGDWAAGASFCLGVGAALKVPVVCGEPMGAHEVNQPGRRDNNPENFRRAGRILGWGPGGTFHSEAGLRSEPWGPVQFACAQAFFEGFAEGEAGTSPRPAEMDGIQAPQGGNSFGPKLPDTIKRSIALVAAQYPDLLQGDDAARRILAGKIAQQARWACGESWGWKRADSGRPLSKDAIAQMQPDGKLFAWDMFKGSLPRSPWPDPDAMDITGQIFVPVEPFNWLA